MTPRIYKVAVVLMWLALPTSAWEYRCVWQQLPARMAVHFDANWQPNGYTSRQGALDLGLGIMVLILVIFTVSTLIMQAMKPSAAWPTLLVAYVVLGFCWYGNHRILKFNLKAQAAHSELVAGKEVFQFPVVSSHSTHCRTRDLKTGY
jgi:hypothetical protein